MCLPALPPNIKTKKICVCVLVSFLYLSRCGSDERVSNSNKDLAEGHLSGSVV